MAKLLCAILLLLSTLTLSITASPSPSSLPSAAASNCTNVLMGMMECLGFVEEGTNVTAPPPKCCSEFQVVLKANAECVCEGLKLASGSGMKINMTRALGLPQACSVPSPDLSACGGSPSSPLPAPVHPPTPAKPSPPPTQLTPSPAPLVSLPLPPNPSQPSPTPTMVPLLSPAQSTLPPSPAPAPAPSSSSSVPPLELLLCVGVAIASLFSHLHV